MRAINLIILTTACLICLSACKHPEQTAAEPAFFQGDEGAGHGHEELIDIAVWKVHGDLQCESAKGALCDRSEVDRLRIRESGLIFTSLEEIHPWGTPKDFFTTADIHKPGWKSMNPLVMGSMAADFPKAVPGFLPADNPKSWDGIERRARRFAGKTFYEIYCAYYGADHRRRIWEWRDADGKTLKVTDCGNYSELGPGMDVHFLRKWLEKSAAKCPEGYLATGDGRFCLETAASACEAARRRIVRATAEAVKFWLAGSEESRYLAQFFAGMALHGIQDSFAKAHTVRSGKTGTGRELENLCFYNTNLELKNAGGACKHKSQGYVTNYDLRDNIWGGAIGTFVSSSRWTDNSWRNYDKLKPEAQTAIEASRAYLAAFAGLVKDLQMTDESAVAKNELLASIFDDAPNPYAERVKRSLETGFFSDAGRIGEGYFADCDIDPTRN